jgi:hypothetical protein
VNDDETSERLRELRSLREQGLISREEAYRRHEAILGERRPSEPPGEPIAAPPEPTAAATRRLAPPPLALLAALLFATAALVAYAAARGRSVPAPENATPPLPTFQAPAATATPASGCYSIKSPEDALTVLSADPPLGGPPPTDSIRLTLRYTLASHPSARVALQVSSGGVGSSTLGPSITVSQGTGVIVLQEPLNLTDPASYTYSVYMHPPPSAYLGAGFTCWRPLVSLQLAYSR